MTASTTVKAWATIAFLVFVLGACGGGDGPTEPPPPPPGVATTVTASSATTLTGTVAQPVAERPSVIVRDQRGAVMSGVSVTFAVTSGGGSATGTTVSTDASGVATAGGWTLGSTAGANNLTATVSGLSAVTFTATGVADSPASMTKTAGDGQTAAVGSAVSVAPSVTIRDAYNNPVSGVAVTFAVASGGGSVTGGTQTTNSAGVATVGSWRLGNPGTNTLTATLSGVPVTFTATATAQAACSISTAHALGTTTSGQLSTSDCQLPTGPYVDLLSISLGAASGYLFTQSSTAFNTYLYLSATDGSKIAENDDATGSNSAIKAFLPSGNYVLRASSFASGATGAYAVTSSTTSTNVTNCEKVFVARGVTTTQQLQATDCRLAADFYDDQYSIYLSAGQAVTISMNSTAVDSYLELYSAAGLILADNDIGNATTSDARIVFTPATSGYFIISASSYNSFEIGSYTLIIQ